MSYSQIRPHRALADYIDVFWVVDHVGVKTKTQRILPDGCIDLIFNVGDDCKTKDGALTMRSEKIYLVGTMTTAEEVRLNPTSKFVGIRFRPGGFSSFYRYSALHELTNNTIEFDQRLSPDFSKLAAQDFSYLNAFFLQKLAPAKHRLVQMVKTIEATKGNISMDSLIKKSFTTARQLERDFKKHLGISPKEFANITRFRFAVERIKQATPQRSLLDIAFECGYYDHAHLSNQVKLYSGVAPSQL